MRAPAPAITAIRRRLGAVRRALYDSAERALGIQTRGIVDLAELGLDAPGREGYEGSGWLDLRWLLRSVEVTRDDVFLDLGAGKGRVLLAASFYPFRSVIGVELSEQLSARARANVAAFRVPRRWRRSGEITVVTSDALTYEIPPDVTCVFMYNPFRGATFDAIAARLIASVDAHPRRLRVLYVNAMEHDRLLATGRFSVERITHRRNRPGLHAYVLEPLQRAG